MSWHIIPASVFQSSVPLAERNTLLLWRGVALVMVILMLLFLYRFEGWRKTGFGAH